MSDQSLRQRNFNRYISIKWSIIGLVALSLVILPASLITVLPRHQAAHASSPGDWATYMMDNGHSGFNAAETIINPTSAPGLKKLWSVKAAANKVTTQPILANGMVYWGSWDGVFHATNLNGTPAWTVNLGQTITCQNAHLGVLSSPTVTLVSINGVPTTAVLVGGGDNNLYALDANAGTVLWKTQLGAPSGSFLYGSPSVFNGSVYIGVSGNADCSHVQGLVMQVNASTGTIQNSFNVMSTTNCTGGSVWTAPTIDEATGKLYFSTGEKGTCVKRGTPTPLTNALVELNAADLSFVAAWQVPAAQQIPDGDFGSTPTLFSATIGGTLHQMVGLENKSGIYYAFDSDIISSGPLWQIRLATNPGPSISSSAWDGTALYVAAGNTTINGSSCPGSLSALNPANGATLWQDCLAIDPTATVTAVPGLIELGAGQFFYVFDASSGNRLFSFQDGKTKSNFMGPGSISNGVLYQGNADGILYAFGP